MSGSRAQPSVQDLERIVADDRKEQMHKKMAAQDADLERSRAAKAAQQAGSELVLFKTCFDAELRDTDGALQAAPEGPEAQAVLADCTKQVERLHSSISAAAHFLPLATR